MSRFMTGTYSTDQSDINVIVHRIFYQNETYVKCKVTLVNKHNGIVYESNKGYQIFKDKVAHWERE